MSGKLGKGEAFGYFMALISVTFSFSPLLFGLLADRIGMGPSMRVFSLPLLFAALGMAVMIQAMKGFEKRKNAVERVGEDI